jgi:DtxR family transcriptional regulator, Mn-dependent transcriptional regulator
MKMVDERDEMLEKLWQLGERGSSTAAELERALGRHWRPALLEALLGEGLARRDGPSLALSEKGRGKAERLIRAHRIGERLIHDVLGREFEPGACEFEHILATEIVDGICTLLGHPRECPHGFPIPEGDCCRASARFVQQTIVPLTELKIGQSARVAYVYAKSDQQLHRLTSLQIRPGSVVRLHQDYPSYVIECDGSSIALDGEVAKNINVWLESAETADAAGREEAGREQAHREAPRPVFTRPGWRWPFGGRGKQGGPAR